MAFTPQRNIEIMVRDSNPREIVNAFYERIWNAGELAAVPDLLAPNFEFRGSLGTELVGRESFTEYVRAVREAVADYRCEILECVSERDRVFAKMRFSGIHVAPLRGFQPTGKPVHWMGAALFHCNDGVISRLWVLGDLARLDALLTLNQQP